MGGPVDVPGDQLRTIAGQHGCVSLVLKRRYRTRNIFRHLFSIIVAGATMPASVARFRMAPI